MMKKSLYFSILIISTLISLSISERCNPQDKKILLQIKTHFGNPYLLASWKPDTDCCTQWYQVKCNSTTNRIISLIIISGKLSGTIPELVGDLPYLQKLDFHKLTNVTGPIPTSVSKLKSLMFLRLNWLSLTGSVPDFSPLKNLTFLDLSYNNLSGSIPASLSLLPNLSVLHLDRNQFSGPIPESYGAFKGSLDALYLSHNQLSGTIPTSLRNLDLDTIDLSRNKLVGDASILFGPNKSTQIVDLSRNSFEFDLSQVVFPSSLTSLDVNHNMIYGGLPKQLVQLNLQRLNVSYNRLCGEIPVGGALQSFDSYNYFHNKCLCGAPLAACE